MKRILLLTLAFLALNIGAKTITLTSQNTMSLSGPVDGQSMTGLMTKLQELNKIETTEPIYLVINSPGGSIYDGFDFIRFAQTSKRKINTVTVFAASMAFQIVESLGDRYVTSYSSLMSHKAKGGFDGEFPGQVDSRYAHILSHIIEQDTEVIKRTNGKQTLESYAKLIQNEYWANANKAIKDGFADEQVAVSCDKSLEGTNSILVNLGFASANVEFSNCPLVIYPISIRGANGNRIVDDADLLKAYNKLFELKNFKF
jgi:ATP-dependent Clp protease protease subunit